MLQHIVKGGHMADQRNDQQSGQQFQGTYNTVVNTVLVLLESSLCAIVGMLPLVLVAFLINDFNYWPTYVVAAALSMPGLAALFAMFRDQPMLFSANASTRARVWFEHMGDRNFPPDWIAEPYVRPDTSVAFIKPYFRAYRRVFLRALAVGAAFWALVFCLIYDMFIMVQLSWGAALVPVLVVVAAMALQSMMVALVLVVEYPKAKYLSVLKNGVILAVRRVPVLLLTVVALAGYVWGLFTWSIAVLVFATGIAAYLVWASANWQASLMFEQLARESGDKRIIDMYQASGSKPSAFGSFFKGTSDYQS